MRFYFNQVLDVFLAQHQRWVLWLPVFMAIGVGAYFSLSAEPPVYMGVFFSAISTLSLIAGWRVLPLRIVFSMMLCIAMGFTSATYRTQLVYTPMLEKDSGTTMITGVVTEVEQQPNGTRVLFESLEIEDFKAHQTPRHIRLKFADRFGVPPLGARIKVLGILLPASSPVAPYSYDFQRHLYFQGIGATGYIVRDFEILSEEKISVLSAEPWREKIKARIQETKSPDDQSKAILTALLTGERRLIAENTWEDIRKAGIAHLLAISGLHIGLVAGFVFFIIRALLALIPPIALRFPIKKISAGLSFIAIFAYCWLIGGTIPSQRAVFMTGIVLFAVMIDRVAISLRLAAFAAAFILILAPESLFTPSFQMSFAAVVSLIAFYEVFRTRFIHLLYGYTIPQKIAVYLFATLVTTIVASIATAPFALYHFQRVSMLPGVWANMIAVPMTAFVIMPFGFLGLCLIPFGGEGLAFKVSVIAIGKVLEVAHWAGNVPTSVATSPAWSQTALIFMVLGALWMAIWTGRLRLVGVPVIVLGIALSVQTHLPDILISAEGKQIAIHNGQGQLALSSSRAERFVRSIWIDEFGGKENVFWPQGRGTLDEYDLSCDAMGCVYKTSALQNIAFPRDVMATYRDCQHASLVIAPQFYDMPDICDGVQKITRGDLKRKGAHAIYLAGADINIITTRDIRGYRPWAP